ncbi:MAG: phosphoenolpyruvate carboxykinase (ATP) [Bacteroidales bacterium]|nr:phosphoenolpyruvate carboxykinase (ATP) [Bacteroidales bacterium]
MVNKIRSWLESFDILNNTEIYYNLSYEELYIHEVNPNNKGFEKVFVTKCGAIAVDTGIYTGRSPKDKYIVFDENTANVIWWQNAENKKSDNKPLTIEKWKYLLQLMKQHLSGRKLFVNDVYAGASESSRIKIRFVSEIAWASHFVKNMFINIPPEEIESFTPDFIIFHAPYLINEKWKEMQMNSEIFIVFNLTERIALIGGTWYGGEIKKGVFTIMNYYLPLKGVLSMHCSANMGKEKGDVALFFGLSGTGKTSLSADPKRLLIGDDEHGWDNEGIFNFEGGCYAKCINLNPDKERDIYNAIKRNAILENVVYDVTTGEIDFNNASKTENTRASYPLYHIENIVKPVSKGGHPQNIIFLTADAFGVLPPVAILDEKQAMYYFINGYTSKLAGTERGIIEPIPTFSACFGAAFLPLPPIYYAELLEKKIKEHKTKVYLINTGWVAGPYGTGYRIDINLTRKIIDYVLNGVIEKQDFTVFPIFNFKIPTSLPEFDNSILNPVNLWPNKEDYQIQLRTLAKHFIENFKQFENTKLGKEVSNFGPSLL